MRHLTTAALVLCLGFASLYAEEPTTGWPVKMKFPGSMISSPRSLAPNTLALAATRAQAQSSSQPGWNEGRPWDIVGAWFATTPTGLKQLITFHADGIVLRSVPGEVGIDPARPPHTAAHGVWRYLGGGQFGVTIWDIFYDVTTGQLLRYNRLRLEVTLGDDRDEASARAIIDVIDPQGVVVSSRTGTSTLARIPFVPLE
jgi:hypothetical protein